MAGSNIIGDVSVGITGDWSDLQQSIDTAVSAAETGAQQIADAFNIPDAGQALAESISATGDAIASVSDQATTSGEEINQALESAGSSAAALATEVEAGSAAATNALEGVSAAAAEVESPLQSTGDAASEAGHSLESLAEQTEHAGETAHEAEGGFHELLETALELGGIAISAEALKEFAEEALHAYGTVQSVTVSLEHLTGSVEAATSIVEKIKELAATQPFAFPEIAPTIQKMVALGVAENQIEEAMQAIADTSAATTNSFQAVANMFDRMALSGVANARSLATLGINLQQLAAALTEVTGDEVAAGEAAAVFKALPDQATRVDVLTTALQKNAGASKALADTLPGQWQILQNRLEEVMVSIGAALAPLAQAFLTFGNDVVVPTMQHIADQFLEVEKDVAGLYAAFKANLEGIADLFSLVVGPINLLVQAVGKLAPAFKAATDGIAPFKIFLDQMLPVLAAIRESSLVLSTTIEYLGGNYKSMADAAAALNTRLQAQVPEIDNATGAVVKLSKGAMAYVDAQNAANKAVAQAKQTLDELKTAYAAGEVSQQAVIRATNDYEAALQKADVQLKVTANDTVSNYGIIQKSVEAFGKQAATLTLEATKAMGEFGNTVNLVQIEPLIVKLTLLQAALQGVGDQGKFILQSVNAALASLNALVGTAAQTLITLPPDIADVTLSFGKMSAQIAKNGSDITDFVGTAKDQMNGLRNQIVEIPTITQQIGGAMKDAGLKSVESLQATADALTDVIAKVIAAKDAGGEWTAQNQQDLDALINKLHDVNGSIKDVGVSTDSVKVKTENWTKDFTSELNSVSNTFAKLIIEGGNFGQTMITVVDQMAEKILGTLVQSAFGSLINAIMHAQVETRTLGSLMQAIGLISPASGVLSAVPAASGITATPGLITPPFVGGAAQSAPSIGGALAEGTDATSEAIKATATATEETATATQAVATSTSAIESTSAATQAATQSVATATQSVGQGVSSVGTALGGVASTLTGVLGAVGSIGSFVTGIIGDIEQAHTNRVLGQIETNTRYSSIIDQQDQPYIVDYLPFLKNLGPGGSVGGGGSAGAGPDHADLVNIANILTEMLTALHAPAVLGGVLSPGLYSSVSPTTLGNISVTQYIQSSDPTHIARQLNTMLRGRGVQFTPTP